MRSAETTRRRRPLMVTLNFSGPRSGTELPSLVDHLNVDGDDVDAHPERRRRVLIGTLRLGGRGSLGRGDCRAGQDRGGQN